MKSNFIKCTACDGDGYLDIEPCRFCGGAGEVPVKQSPSQKAARRLAADETETFMSRADRLHEQQKDK